MKYFRDMGYTPSEVDTFVNRAIRQNGAGKPEADAQNIIMGNTGFALMCFDALGDVRQYVFAVFFGIGLDFPFIKKGSVLRKNTKLYGCSADIGADRIFHSAPSFDCVFVSFEYG